MTEILVLGAGMVGVSTALALQARGASVVLVDRRGPGEETSYGNAGIIQSEAVEPYAFPRDIASILSIALKRGNDVNWNLAAMPVWARPVWHYFRHSEPARYREIVATYSQLIHRASADHAPLIAAAGADSLITREGFRQVFRSADRMEKAARDAERIRDAHGVKIRVEDGEALAQAEPNLKLRLAGGVHWLEPWTCSSPGGLVAAYSRLFESRGGTILTGDASSLEAASSGWRVQAKVGKVEGEHAVLALGPWSSSFLRRFGYRVPMLFKRGYHRHFGGGTAPRLPVMDTENAAIIAPMEAGSRILTGAELTRFDAQPALRQLERAERGIGELFDLGQPVEKEPWTGNRPCMPDMLPVVGAAPRHKGLWLNFGHGHQGFTLGPTTGALLAEALNGGGGNGELLDRLSISRIG